MASGFGSEPIGQWQYYGECVLGSMAWMDGIGEATERVLVPGVVPRVGIILGSGLGGLAAAIEPVATVSYAEIPHFHTTTANGHAGQWITGYLSGVPCVAMQGRLHIYEGHSAARASFPVRVMRRLGVELLIVSNASGGLNPLYRSGDVMVVDDHINLMFRNPLIGANDEQLGPRFPDMSAPYDQRLIEDALRIARKHDFVAHRGVYAALTGPTYETRAEYRMLRELGADVVGMSTVPEVLVAVHAGMRVLALSAVTNVCRPDCLARTDHQEVVDIAEIAAPKMRRIVQEIVLQSSDRRLECGDLSPL
jgi:purine-nucleoside phosphorylase